MEEKYKIIYSGGENTIIEKKSRFIAEVFPIASEEEAIAKIAFIRKKYGDATHHCFAYVLGEQQQIQRCSDDGEPSGTAGRPILDVLLGEEIHNSVVIVTRYFGGTLLGTGGLVRAYGKAAQEGLANSQIIEKCPGKKYSLRTDYSEIGKIQYTLEQMELTALDTEYTETVKLYVIVPDGECAAFEKKITEATAGRAKLEMEKEVFFARMGGKIRLL